MIKELGQPNSMKSLRQIKGEKVSGVFRRKKEKGTGSAILIVFESGYGAEINLTNGSFWLKSVEKVKKDVEKKMKSVTGKESDLRRISRTVKGTLKTRTQATKSKSNNNNGKKKVAAWPLDVELDKKWGMYEN